MADYDWKPGFSGDWGTPGDWVQGSIPDSSTANATIVSPGSITVTITAGESFTADSVTLGSSTVTLDVAGVLNLAGGADQLVLNTGTLNLEYGGTIANGTIVAGAVNFDGGTLANITYLGALNLSADSDYINIEGELTLLSPGGGAGTINFEGYNDSLVFNNTATLNNVIINMDSSSETLMGDGGTLTLGSAATLNSDVPAPDYSQFNYLDGNAVVNEGLINVVAGTLQIVPDSFSNFGSINVSAGAYLFLKEYSTGNVGTITGDGIVFLGSRYESGELTLANLAEISLTGSGLVDLSGGVDLQGGTLAVSGNDNIAIGSFASIANGTINASLGARFGGSYRTQDGTASDTLNNITWIGDLNVGSSFYKNGQSYTQPEALNIAGAFSLENASGSGSGKINIYNNSFLMFDEAHETLNGVGINLGSASQPVGFAEISGNRGAGDALTFGKTTTINSYGYGTGGTLRGNKIVNDGVININGRFWIDSTTFVNAGTINFHAGSYLLDYRTRSLANTGLFECSGAGTEIANMPTKWVGGIIEVDAFNTLDLAGKLITDDRGTLILNGVGSEIEEKNGSGSQQGSYKKLETTLRTISSSGALEVLGGRGFATSNTLEVAGTLIFGGGAFVANALDIGAGGRFSGFGTIAGAVGNAGVIEAAGGTLVIGGPVTGVGGLQVDAASTLELTTGTSEAVRFVGASGELILEAPSLFTGTLSGIAAGDGIDLAGDTASSARISGTSLLVTLTNSTVLDYTLASALPMEGVSISNGGSGAELTFYQLPAAAAPEMRFMQPSATVADRAAPASRPGSLPPLQDLWSDTMRYRPFFTGHFAQASSTNPQHLQAELGNMPTPANVGIVLAGLQSGEVAHILNHDPTLAPPKGFF